MNNTTSETKRLADAVAGIAATIAEIIDARVNELGGAMEQRVAQKTVQPFFDKRQAAEHFGVSVRTVDNWMSRGFLPYYKIGRTIRIPIEDAESWLREKCLVQRRPRFLR